MAGKNKRPVSRWYTANKSVTGFSCTQSTRECLGMFSPRHISPRRKHELLAGRMCIKWSRGYSRPSRNLLAFFFITLYILSVASNNLTRRLLSATALRLPMSGIYYFFFKLEYTLDVTMRVQQLSVYIKDYRFEDRKKSWRVKGQHWCHLTGIDSLFQNTPIISPKIWTVQPGDVFEVTTF
jgi:hypothetical protein